MEGERGPSEVPTEVCILWASLHPYTLTPSPTGLRCWDQPGRGNLSQKPIAPPTVTEAPQQTVTSVLGHSQYLNYRHMSISACKWPDDCARASPPGVGLAAAHGALPTLASAQLSTVPGVVWWAVRATASEKRHWLGRPGCLRMGSRQPGDRGSCERQDHTGAQASGSYDMLHCSSNLTYKIVSNIKCLVISRWQPRPVTLKHRPF